MTAPTDLGTFDLTRITIEKTIADAHWHLAATIPGPATLPAAQARVKYTATDYAGTSHVLFAGLLMTPRPTLTPTGVVYEVDAYDYTWYLSHNPVAQETGGLTCPIGTDPSEKITELLGSTGGTSWAVWTGVEPYDIDTVSGYGSTVTAKAFSFSRETTKWAAIEEFSKWCRHVPYVDWGGTDNAARMFWVAESAIDTALGLPAKVTITKPDPYLLGKVTWTEQGDGLVNEVTVYGTLPDGTGTYGTIVGDGNRVTVIPVVAVETNASCTSTTQCTTRAQEIFDRKSVLTKTYTATFVDRCDLQLLQQIEFSGYDEIATGTMRITAVRHEFSPAAKLTTIQFMLDQNFWDLRSDYRDAAPTFVDQVKDAVTTPDPGTTGHEIIGINWGGQFGTVLAVATTASTCTVRRRDGTQVEAEHS